MEKRAWKVVGLAVFVGGAVAFAQTETAAPAPGGAPAGFPGMGQGGAGGGFPGMGQGGAGGGFGGMGMGMTRQTPQEMLDTYDVEVKDADGKVTKAKDKMLDLDELVAMQTARFSSRRTGAGAGPAAGAGRSRDGAGAAAGAPGAGAGRPRDGAGAAAGAPGAGAGRPRDGAGAGPAVGAGGAGAGRPAADPAAQAERAKTTAQQQLDQYVVEKKDADGKVVKAKDKKLDLEELTAMQEASANRFGGMGGAGGGFGAMGQGGAGGGFGGMGGAGGGFQMPQAMIDQYDTDKDGELSETERAAMMEGMRGQGGAGGFGGMGGGAGGGFGGMGARPATTNSAPARAPAAR